MFQFFFWVQQEAIGLKSVHNVGFLSYFRNIIAARYKIFKRHFHKSNAMQTIKRPFHNNNISKGLPILIQYLALSSLLREDY